jgi:RNA polymerase sigma-70 factor (ECF subfamily)
VTLDDAMAGVAAEDRETQYVRLLRDYDAPVRRLAASYERLPARRQDLLQDIWLALWQALGSFRGGCSERTFVFRIAHNRGINHVRRWRLRNTEPLDEIAVEDGAPDPEREASQRQQRERLQAAVARLPLGLRQATVLMLEGLDHGDIADVLGISENNVAVRLTRARAALTRALADSGGAR